LKGEEEERREWKRGIEGKRKGKRKRGGEEGAEERLWS